jgi:hypothetical protein
MPPSPIRGRRGTALRAAAVLVEQVSDPAEQALAFVPQAFTRGDQPCEFLLSGLINGNKADLYA